MLRSCGNLKEQLQKRHIVSTFTTPEDLQARITYDVPSQLEEMGVEIEGERGERPIVRGQQRRRELPLQAALRALLIEILGSVELALNGSHAVISWSDPSGKMPADLEVIAQAFEGKIPFPAAKYFRDRVWSQYEEVFLENLDSATIYAVDSAYRSARQVFDFVGAPLPQGATTWNISLRYLLWRCASDFSKVIPLILERLTNADERKGLEPRIQKMTSMLDSQSKVVN